MKWELVLRAKPQGTAEVHCLPRMREACASACSAAPSIRLTRRTARRRAALRRLGLIGCGGWSRRVIRSRTSRIGRSPSALPGARSGHHPRIDVSDSKRSRHQLHLRDHQLSRAQLPGVHFVWIMVRNLRHFHRWQRWRDIAALVPIAVIDRLGRAFTRRRVSPVRRSPGANSGVSSEDAVGTKAPSWIT